jgi:hypothetical protein
MKSVREMHSFVNKIIGLYSSVFFSKQNREAWANVAFTYYKVLCTSIIFIRLQDGEMMRLRRRLRPLSHCLDSVK